MLTDSSELIISQPPNTTASVSENVTDHSDNGHSAEPLTKKLRLSAPRSKVNLLDYTLSLLINNVIIVID